MRYEAATKYSHQTQNLQVSYGSFDTPLVNVLFLVNCIAGYLHLHEGLFDHILQCIEDEIVQFDIDHELKGRSAMFYK